MFEIHELAHGCRRRHGLRTKSVDVDSFVGRRLLPSDAAEDSEDVRGIASRHRRSHAADRVRTGCRHDRAPATAVDAAGRDVAADRRFRRTTAFRYSMARIRHRRRLWRRRIRFPVRRVLSAATDRPAVHWRGVPRLRRDGRETAGGACFCTHGESDSICPASARILST